jgi:hypothetical protein
MPEQTQEEKVSVKYIQAPEYRSMYTNSAAFQLGPYDVGISFGEVVEVDQKNEIATVEQRVKVMMSPLHAKILTMQMVEQIKAFENNFGKIVIPPGMVKLAKQAEEESPEKPKPAKSAH